MKRKRVLAAFLAAALAASCFAGCKGGEPSSSAAAKPGSAASSATSSGVSSNGEEGPVSKTGFPVMQEEHTFKIVHSISTGDLVGNWEDKDYTRKIEEDTGLKIEWVGIPQNSYNDQVGIQLAANDMPDVFWNGVPSFSQFVGNFTALDEYLADYSPTVVKFFQEYPSIKAASVFPDGALYGLPQVQMNNTRATGVYFINKDWLGNVGMQAPNTLDELYEVLKAFKEQDANGNGDPSDEIPFSFGKKETLTGLLAPFGIYGNGSPDNIDTPYLNVKDGKVTFYPIEDSYYQFLQYMNKLYREGLIDPNSFVQEEVDIQAKGKEGKVGTLWVGSYIDIMVGDRGDEYEYFLPLENAEGKRTYVPNKFSGDVNPNRFIVTKNCEYPAAMVRLYDYLNSSFANKLLFDWGPEGEAWEKTEDGKILRLNADLPEGFSSYAEVRHTLSMGVLGPILWDDADQAEFAITNDRDVEYYARRDPLMEYAIDDKDQIPVGQDTVENSQEAAVLITEIRTYMDNFQSEAIMKGIDDAKWQKHLEDVQKYDITRYVEIKQAFYDRMMELLGGKTESGRARQGKSAGCLLGFSE